VKEEGLVAVNAGFLGDLVVRRGRVTNGSRPKGLHPLTPLPDAGGGVGPTGGDAGWRDGAWKAGSVS